MTGPLTAPTDPGRGRRVGLLVAGWVIAVAVLAFGAWSLVDALVENDQVVDYANTRDEAQRVATVGRQVVRAGEELCGCDTRSVQLRQQARDALAAGNPDQFNDLVAQINAEADRGNAQLARIQSLISGL